MGLYKKAIMGSVSFKSGIDAVIQGANGVGLVDNTPVANGIKERVLDIYHKGMGSFIALAEGLNASEHEYSVGDVMPLIESMGIITKSMYAIAESSPSGYGALKETVEYAAIAEHAKKLMDNKNRLERNTDELTNDGGEPSM